MAISDKFDETMNKIGSKTEELAGKAKRKINERLTPEKRDEYKQKLNDAKEKISEQFTEEKRAGYKEKFDGFMESAERELTDLGSNVGREIKNAFGKKEK